MAARVGYGTALVRKNTGRILDVDLEKNEQEARRLVAQGNKLIEESNAKPGVELPYRWAVVEIRELEA